MFACWSRIILFPSARLFAFLSSSSVSDPSPSGLIPKAVEPIQGIHRFKVQSGLPFSPKSSQSSSSLSRGPRRGRPVSTGAAWEKMTASLQEGLAPLVWLWGSQPVDSPRAMVAVTPSTTQRLLCCRPRRSDPKTGHQQQFVLQQTCLRSLKWVDDQVSSPSVC